MSAHNHPFTLTQWLNHCEQLHPQGAQGIKLGLDTLALVAKRLHNGHGVHFNCPVFMVAGTNGKGSTCAMLESILRRAGYRTGLFTSPHFVHFNERCQINNEPVANDTLAQHFAAVEHARGDTQLSYFEFTTLAILDCLASSKLDAVILEVGLGGRLDAVNIIDADCAIITNIDIDHTAYLGDTKEAIAYEKAGIMRPNKPVIIADAKAPSTLMEQAQAIGADAQLAGRDFTVHSDRQQWAWTGRKRRYSGLAWPALRGAHQMTNAAGVLAAIAAMHHVLPVTAQAIRNGLAMVSATGRFQVLPGQPAIVLDVAHNPHSAQVLVHNLDDMGFYPATHAVFGAMQDKDTAAILRTVYPLIDHWYFTNLPTTRAACATHLQQQFEQISSNATHTATSQTFTSPQHAMQAAVAAAQTTDRIVVFGSFYTVADVLAADLPKSKR